MSLDLKSPSTAIIAYMRTHKPERRGSDRQATRQADCRNGLEAAHWVEYGLRNVRFELGDAEIDQFERGALDHAISRCGVMFFADPRAAFRNIARALAPGATLAFVCWREALGNEWITVPGSAALAFVELPDLADPTAPGPFAFADPQYVTKLLQSAGFRDVQLTPVNEPLIVGANPADAMAFFKDTGIGRTILADADPVTVRHVEAAVEQALVDHMTPNGVSLGSAAWLTTARR
jgi:SAM-dependent methyltransferase